MQLFEQDITLSEACVDKTTAIALVAQQLALAGYITEDYLPGMLAREAQISTFLGNSIAIPHGTPETRHAVLNTGVKVVVFPQGVDWGEGNSVRVVVGIASRSNEHLTILRQLTHALIDDTVPTALERARTPADFLAILCGNGNPSGARTIAVGAGTENPEANAVSQAEEAQYRVQDPYGLHARPAALLVKVIKQFSCTVSVMNLTAHSAAVDARKLMNVISLEAKYGDRLHFTASGTDALAALAAIGTLLNQNR